MEKATSDVVVDLIGSYSVFANTTSVSFNIILFADVTTVGVYEVVGVQFVTQSTNTCSGGSINLKQVLQNLPPRTYSVKAYAAIVSYTGLPATLGIGATSGPSCGNNNPSNQKMVISVSQ